MSKTTTNWSIPYPELTDLANVPEAMENLAETVDTALTTLSNKILACFPIGTIITTSVNESPANYIGGTWELVTDRVIIGAGNNYETGETGGASTVTLTASQLPEITGSFKGSSNIVKNVNGGTLFGGTSGVFSTSSNNTDTSQADATVVTTSYTNQINMSFGGGEAHNNMPPYIAKYMWERTA